MLRGVDQGVAAEIALRVRPGRVADAAPVEAQRVRGDADAVRVPVRGLHDVAEPQPPGRARPTAERGLARLAPHPDRQHRASGHLHRLREVQPHPDPLARAVGLAVLRAAADPQAAHRGSGRLAAVHLVLRGVARRWPSKSENRGHTVSGLDVAAVQSQSIGRDADTVCVPVVRLHDVAEPQPLVASLASTLPPPTVPSRLTGEVAYLQIQCRSPGHFDRIGEVHADSDLLACSIAITVLWAATDCHGVRPSACGRAAVAGNDRKCHWNLDTCLSPRGFPLSVAGSPDCQLAPVSVVRHAGSVRHDGNLLHAATPTDPFLRIGREPCRVRNDPVPDRAGCLVGQPDRLRTWVRPCGRHECECPGPRLDNPAAPHLHRQRPLDLLLCRRNGEANEVDVVGQARN